jgi:Nif-specific regulatory protein
MKIISQCELPGNVRELENCVQRAAVISRDFVLRGIDLPCTIGRCFNHLTIKKKKSTVNTGVEDLLQIENERERVITALELSGWVQAKAARLLNQTPRQIGYRIKKLNIELKSY